jgi:hypothetical protein
MQSAADPNSNYAKLKDAIMELGMERFDPVKEESKTWYHMPIGFKTGYEGRFIQPYFLQTMRIPKRNRQKEQLLHEYLHEMGHLEELPFELTVLLSSWAFVLSNIGSAPPSGNGILDVASHLGIAALAVGGYLAAKEGAAELYCIKKLGWNRWRREWKESGIEMDSMIREDYENEKNLVSV